MAYKPMISQFDELESFLRVNEGGARKVHLMLLEHPEELPDEVLEKLYAWSRKDLEKIARFRHRGARTSWCMSRFLVRKALSIASGRQAVFLEPTLAQFGKPYLPDSNLRFNWSHCPGCVAFALTEGREVGCDIEDSTRMLAGHLDMARAYYSADELGWLEAAPGRTIAWQRFLALFVQKEAKLKACGTGLSDLMAAVPCTMRDPPFRDKSCLCIRHGPAGRYLVAVAIVDPARSETVDGCPSTRRIEVAIRAHRYHMTSDR